MEKKTKKIIEKLNKRGIMKLGNSRVVVLPSFLFRYKGFNPKKPISIIVEQELEDGEKPLSLNGHYSFKNQNPNPKIFARISNKT